VPQSFLKMTKIAGQNDVKLIDADVCMSHEGLGQAWDKRGTAGTWKLLAIN
jgi:hypothetical protein